MPCSSPAPEARGVRLPAVVPEPLLVGSSGLRAVLEGHGASDGVLGRCEALPSEGVDDALALPVPHPPAGQIEAETGTLRRTIACGLVLVDYQEGTCLLAWQRQVSTRHASAGTIQHCRQVVTLTGRPVHAGGSAVDLWHVAGVDGVHCGPAGVCQVCGAQRVRGARGQVVVAPAGR